MKDVWVALPSAPFLCLFLSSQHPTQDKMHNLCHVLREAEVVIHLVQLEAGSLSFLFSQQWKPSLSLVASCHVPCSPPQLFLHFSNSSCSYLLMNQKSLFLHWLRASWGQHCQLGYCCQSCGIWQMSICSSWCIYVIRWGFQRGNVTHECCSMLCCACLQHADETQNLRSFRIPGFLAA